MYKRQELNSPVLGWDDLGTVCQLIEALQAAGAKTNGAFCGIHVHIGDEAHTPASLRNLVNLVNANEDLLTLALGITPERRNRWCRPVDPHFLRQLTTEGIIDAIRREDGCLRYDYFLSVQNADEILLVEQWESEEKQQVHLRAAHMDRLRELKAQYVADARLGKVRLD